MPKRPSMANLNAKQIDEQETKFFSEWIQNIENKLKGRMNYYEHNIEVCFFFFFSFSIFLSFY